MLGGLERYFSVRCCVAHMESLALNYYNSLLVPPSVAHLVTYVQKCNTSTKQTTYITMLYLSLKTAFHNIELKCKKRKGLNCHKFWFCHFGNFCFKFVWLRVSSYFFGSSVLCFSFIVFLFSSFLFLFSFFVRLLYFSVALR